MHPTKIEWTDFAWNPIRARNRETGEVGHYCQKISPACTNCYAAAFNVAQRHKRKDGQPGKSGTGLDFIPASLSKLDLFLDEEELYSPLRRKKPARIFVCDMTDLFLDAHPTAWIARVLMIAQQAHWHTFQILTKRPERMLGILKQWSDLKGEPDSPQLARGPEATRKVHPSGRGRLFADILESLGSPPPGCAFPTFDWMEGPRWWAEIPSNIHVGVTVENQEQATKRLVHLVQTPAAARFVSYEPALELVDFEQINLQGAYRLDALRGQLHGLITRDIQPTGRIHQLIMGGESGRGARPMHPTWARATRDRCVAAGVGFFFKQWGDWAPWEGAGIGTPAILGRRINDQGQDITGISELWCDDENMTDAFVFPVGKAKAGRLLDGRTWDEFPTVTKGHQPRGRE